MTEEVFAGIDLHGNNVMIGIVDEKGRRLKHQKLGCDLKAIAGFLEPWKEQLKSVAVESTYNWYWLVDGLRALSYPIKLANPAGMEQYNGIKHADDKNDAFFLADLQRLNILPTGYIYDPVLRPVRDLLRRRLGLVRQRTALLLSFKSLYARTTGQALSLSRLKAMEPNETKTLYQHPAQLFNRFAAQGAHRQALPEHRANREDGISASAGTTLLSKALELAGSGAGPGPDHEHGSG